MNIFKHLSLILSPGRNYLPRPCRSDSRTTVTHYITVHAFHTVQFPAQTVDHQSHITLQCTPSTLCSSPLKQSTISHTLHYSARLPHCAVRRSNSRPSVTHYITVHTFHTVQFPAQTVDHQSHITLQCTPSTLCSSPLKQSTISHTLHYSAHLPHCAVRRSNSRPSVTHCNTVHAFHTVQFAAQTVDHQSHITLQCTPSTLCSSPLKQSTISHTLQYSARLPHCAVPRSNSRTSVTHCNTVHAFHTVQFPAQTVDHQSHTLQCTPSTLCSSPLKQSTISHTLHYSPLKLSLSLAISLFLTVSSPLSLSVSLSLSHSLFLSSSFSLSLTHTHRARTHARTQAHTHTRSHPLVLS